MNVLVTGASGNFGTSLLTILAEDPAIVKIVALSRHRPAHLPSKVSFIKADITKTNLVPLLEDIDVVVHAAWLTQPQHNLELLEKVNIEGSKKVIKACIEASVKKLIYLSSVGVYSSSSKERVSENYPRRGIKSSDYSKQKVAVEDMLDYYELKHPNLKVVRLRPGIMTKPDALVEQKNLFLGRLFPKALLKITPPFVPSPNKLKVAAVLTDDVARAAHLAIKRDVVGPFNLANFEPLTPQLLAKIFSKPTIPFPAPLLRFLVKLLWHLRIVPTGPGWLDMACHSPLLATDRARRELDWYQSTRTEDLIKKLLRSL